MDYKGWSFGLLALVAAAGCGAEGDGVNVPIGAGSSGGAPLNNTGGAGNAGAAGMAGRGGSAGTNQVTTAGMGGAGRSGAGGAGAGGSGGASGSSGGSGGGSSGMGGAGGGGSGGSGIVPSGDCYCRGEAPTAETANGENEGPYMVESYTSGFRNGSGFADATIFHPMGATPPFGCVAVVPGYQSPQSSIRTWGPFLASHGIVTITIGTNSGGDSPQVRSRALMDALVTCNEENMRSGSPLMGKLDTMRNGVAGWSMGGGGTLIAASANPELDAAVSFAAWGPTGGAQNKVPALMFEATADFLAAGMSDGYYGAVPDTTPKMLFEVQGSSHNVANNPANHDGIIGLYGLSWFKVFLEKDERYRQFLTAAKPSITTSKFATNVK
jgi:dienelactone hydrolase